MVLIKHYLKVGIIAVVVLAGIGLLAYKPKLVLKENLVFEYGDKKPLIEELIDIDNSVYTSITLSFDEETVNELLGSNTVEITAHRGLQRATRTVEYEVEDTHYPILSGVKDYSLELGSDADFSEITANDIVDGNLEVKIVGDYDNTQPGTYDVEAIAVDSNGNTSKKSFQVEVLESKTVEDSIDEATNNSPISVDKPSSSSNDNKGKVEDVPVTIKYVGGHIVANKQYPLPSDYNPGENKQARSQLNLLIAEMQGLGLNISNSISGYRNYDYQAKLYNNYVKSYGVEAANRLIAKPGYSEHQTGLSFDLKHQDGSLVGNKNFQASMAEVTWIAENAVRYGFIVRYPLDKESITGYQYEPWHLRYLGDDAQKVYDSGLTMEEYFGF